MSVKRKPRPKLGHTEPRYTYVACPSGKRGYITKAEAKVIARRLRKQGDGSLMNAYRCEACGLIHLGHLPLAVRTGEVGRREYFSQEDAA